MGLKGPSIRWLKTWLASWPVEGIGYRVWGSGFKVWGLGFRVWGCSVEAGGNESLPFSDKEYPKPLILNVVCERFHICWGTFNRQGMRLFSAARRKRGVNTFLQGMSHTCLGLRGLGFKVFGV